MRFVVHLKNAHDRSGLTYYAVSKRTGIAINTVVRYTQRDAVEVGYLAPSVIQLAQFYGLDWRDPGVIEVIDDEEEDEEQPLMVLGETKLG